MNATNATWYESTRSDRELRPHLNYELDADVCVIGGGLAGLSIARKIARRGWSVVLLEAKRLAGAASGRNTGFVIPGYSETTDAMIERIGLDHTKQLWALSEQGLADVRHMIEETGMAGVDPVPGWLHVSKTDDGERNRVRVERLRWIGAEVEFWPTERVRAELANPRYYSAVHFPTAFHINPLNYALGLARAAEQAGVRIFENTPAVELDPTGVRKRISTPEGHLRAGHIVLAGGLDIRALMPRLAATLLPVSTYVLVTEPLGPAVHELIRYRGAVSDTNRADNHYRIVDGANPSGARLQWSGRMRTWAANPRFAARGLVNDIRRNYPALEKIEIAHLWRGTLGRPLHRMPQLGELDPGLWVASGFGGHGLNTTAMAGELIARAIIDRDETWRLFAPYELVWAGGFAGRALAQAIYWGSRPVDRAAAWLAQKREQEQKRKAARRAAAAAAKAAE